MREKKRDEGSTCKVMMLFVDIFVEGTIMQKAVNNIKVGIF